MPEKNGQFNDSGGGILKPSRWWWFGQTLLTAVAFFFVCFGISLLAASYRLTDPFSFIMTFFAASLIFLISVVMVMGFVLRMIRVMRACRDIDDHRPD